MSNVIHSIVYSGSITPAVLGLMLKPDRNYQVQVSGMAQKKNLDISLTAAPVIQIKNFKTNSEVVVDPVPVFAQIGTITVADNLEMSTSYILPAITDPIGRVVSRIIS